MLFMFFMKPKKKSATVPKGKNMLICRSIFFRIKGKSRNSVCSLFTLSDLMVQMLLLLLAGLLQRTSCTLRKLWTRMM